MSNLDKAIIYACDKHKGMFRKGDNQPYIYHPLEVLGIASLITNDDDVLCACVLHDVIEDTGATKEEIASLANERVAKLVANESENKRGNVNKESTWKTRKQETIDTINNSDDIGTKIVCLSDKLANLRSFNRLVLTKGDDAWNRFNMKDPKMHYWYFEELRKAFEKDLGDTGIYKEYCFMIDALFSRYFKEEK